jgi:hypothetical protein
MYPVPNYADLYRDAERIVREAVAAASALAPSRRLSGPPTAPWCSSPGGAKAGDKAMLEKARQSMEAGATGLIFGRNVWQRAHDDSLRFVAQLRDVLTKYPSL